MDRASWLPTVWLGILEKVLLPFVPDLLAFADEVAEWGIWMGLPIEGVLGEVLQH